MMILAHGGWCKALACPGPDAEPLGEGNRVSGASGVTGLGVPQ
jgi:hypothetical protein